MPTGVVNPPVPLDYSSLFCPFKINIYSDVWGFTAPLLQNWAFTVYFLTRAPQDLNKRLSLPADIRIPDGYLEKLQLSSPPFDQPLSRRSRRASLVSAAGTIKDTSV